MKDTISIIPLGGIGNVAKNLYVYQYAGKILLVDCGIGFPDPNMLGVDILIPDINYLKDKTDQIVGMLLTHGHDDHIAGLPYVLPQLHTKFPIYGSKLTLGFAKDRLKEYNISADFKDLPPNGFDLGPFHIQDIHVTHSVPDSRHFVISTKAGTIYHGSDFKFDLNPVDNNFTDFQKIANLSQNGISALLVDCLNAEVDTYSKSESTLKAAFLEEARGVKGKVIFTIMSSNIHRIQQIAHVANYYRRKLVFVGRSIEQNVRTAQRLGFLKLPANIFANKRQIKRLQPDKLCLIVAGSQGQIGSSLQRAAEGDHSLVHIEKDDKVIFASEAIPGNEQNVYATIDSISKIGADVAYSDIVDLHASGHSSSIEQKILINLTKPKHLIPIGGTYHHMTAFRNNARSLGYSDKAIHLLDNGQTINISHDRAFKDKKIHLQNVMIDGLGIGDVGQVVLRDRQKMSEDGMVIILVPISQQTGQVNGDIEVISRGFVYIKESKDLINQIKSQAASCLTQQEHVVTNWQAIRKKIENRVEKLIYTTTQRRPLLLTVVIEV